MKIIVEWLKAYYDPQVVLFFIILCAYSLMVDVPDLRQKNLFREAIFFTVMGWISMIGYLGLFIFVLLM